MRKQLYNRARIDTEKYVNVDTGETLQSEHGTITSVNKPNSDYVKMSSEMFYIIDDKAMRYLETVLSKSDMNHLYLMTGMVYGAMNILHNKSNQAHNRKSLMSDLAIARTAFSGLLTRLSRKGVIYEMKGYKNGKQVKYIMLNPNIARRTNIIHKECSQYFQTFK